jgi:hypothetical protein
MNRADKANAVPNKIRDTGSGSGFRTDLGSNPFTILRPLSAILMSTQKAQDMNETAFVLKAMVNEVTPGVTKGCENAQVIGVPADALLVEGAKEPRGGERSN